MLLCGIIKFQTFVANKLIILIQKQVKEIFNKLMTINLKYKDQSNKHLWKNNIVIINDIADDPKIAKFGLPL